MNLVVKSFVAGAVALIAAACNTVEGVGQDTQEVGEEIEETANEAR